MWPRTRRCVALRRAAYGRRRTPRRRASAAAAAARMGSATSACANQSTAAIYLLRPGLDRGPQARRRRRAGSPRPRPGPGGSGGAAIARSSGSWPQTQTGKSGGQVQPRSCSRRNCLTIRSSSEWKRDHGEAAARAQHLERRRQRRLERAELVVDRDAQRLEDALRRMAVAEARRRRDRALDRVDELAGALERLLAAAPHDRARDLPRVALLAVAAEDRHELALAASSLTMSRARRASCVGVHAHVERRVDRVREAALGPVELHRRDAEVEQDRVGAHAVRRRAAAGRRRSRRAGAAPARRRASRSRSKYVRAVGSRSIAISLPRPWRSAASSAAWPPAPKVASTTVSPGLHGEATRAPPSARTGT